MLPLSIIQLHRQKIEANAKKRDISHNLLVFALLIFQGNHMSPKIKDYTDGPTTNKRQKFTETLRIHSEFYV